MPHHTEKETQIKRKPKSEPCKNSGQYIEVAQLYELTKANATRIKTTQAAVRIEFNHFCAPLIIIFIDNGP